MQSTVNHYRLCVRKAGYASCWGCRYSYLYSQDELHVYGIRIPNHRTQTRIELNVYKQNQVKLDVSSVTHKMNNRYLR